MKGKAHFGPELFAFLSDLRRNNRREWFLANKGRYEVEVRDPMLRFIGDFAGPLRKISRHFVADAKPSGGSLFRLHRDTRFSRDKSPYKTNVAAHFRHEAARDAHAPGFYLHLEPDQVFLAAGRRRAGPGAASDRGQARFLEARAVGAGVPGAVLALR